MRMLLQHIKVLVSPLLVLLICLMSMTLSAQVDGDVVIKQVDADVVIKRINGKKYYVHTVEPGHTLYAISKKYSVSIEDIIEANPEAEQGLSINQVLTIPVKKTDKRVAQDNPPAMDGKFLIHTVAPKETLYALSKKYNVEIKDILIHNESAIDGLREGAQIRIPTNRIAVENKETLKPAIEDSLVAHVVQSKETLYSLSKQYGVSIDSIKLVNKGLPLGLKEGTTIRIPKVKEGWNKAEPIPFVPVPTYVAPGGIIYSEDTATFRSVYNVALMLPFYLDMNDTIAKNRRVNEKEMIYPKSETALEFYEGALIAIDSLKGKGLNVRLHVYDTRNDTNVVKALLQGGEMPYMNLFIGPLYTSNFDLVSVYAKEKDIAVVCPVTKSNRILLGNPHVSKVSASWPVQLDELASYVYSEYSPNQVMIVNSMKARDEVAVKTLKQYSDNVLAQKDSLSGDTARILRMWSINPESIMRAMDPDTVNVLVVPSNDQPFVSSLLTTLYNLLSKDYRIVVYGMEQWVSFEEKLDINHLHKLSVHVTSPVNIEYSEIPTMKFVKHYRDIYHTDPGKFAFTGFDVTYYYLSAMQQHGTAFQGQLSKMKTSALSTSFDYFKTSPESGYENRCVYILKYEDFKLKTVN